MHYYPPPFKPHAFHPEADNRIDLLIVLVVSLLCVAILSAIVWP